MRRFTRSALALGFAAVVGLASAAHAGTSVSNLDEPRGSNTGANFLPFTSFTTGAEDQLLNFVTLKIGSFSTGTAHAVIQSDNSGSRGALLYDLGTIDSDTTPFSFEFLADFAAPANSLLAANTTYWVALTGNVFWWNANSPNQTGLPGWSIQDNGLTVAFGGTSPFQFSVDSSDLVSVPEPATAGLLALTSAGLLLRRRSRRA